MWRSALGSTRRPPRPGPGTRTPPAQRRRRPAPVRLEHRLLPIDIRPDRWQKLGVIGALVNSLSVLALGAGLYLTNQDNREQRQIEMQAQVSERFTKAIEQLGSVQLDVRLGGIYSLDRLMNDSPPDRPTVVEVLSAYVRDHTATPAPSTKEKKQPRPTTDVQAALTVIGRRPNPLYTRPDLAGANLAGANLAGTDLAGADLTGANLTTASLFDADLRGASLFDADLAGANLAGADLTRANLLDADLTGADLTHANLTHAYLTRADLTHADLTGAVGGPVGPSVAPNTSPTPSLG